MEAIRSSSGCSCGELSPHLTSSGQRRRWHREHKADVLEQARAAASPLHYMDLGEFRELGFLQEVNRLVLHPAGLALEWHPGWTREQLAQHFKDNNNLRVAAREMDVIWAAIRLLGLHRPHLSGVWDHRDDAEGIVFVKGPEPDKIRSVADELVRHVGPRIRLLGGPIQQIGQSVVGVTPHDAP